MMLSLKSFLRSALAAHLICASLLLPALHLHLVDDHRHDSGEIHRHRIVHAHFLNSLAQKDTGTAGFNRHSDESSADGNEIGLVTLTSHRSKDSDQPFHKQLYFLADGQRQVIVGPHFRAVAGKPDSPPRLPEFQFLGSPRSPPASA